MSRDMFKENKKMLFSVTKFTLEIWYSVINKFEEPRFFRHLQIRNYLEKEIKPDFPCELNGGIVAQCNSCKNITGRVISVLYQVLVKSRETSTVCIRDKR